MRCIAISDTHNRAESVAIPDGDVLLHAGDLTMKGGWDELMRAARWLGSLRERFPGLEWWEFAAACGSSLPVFALIALASRETVGAAEIDATARAYFPGVSALHILLDYFIDQAEDREHGELNFVACYASSAEAVARLRQLVTATLARVRGLADRSRHRFLVEAMCVFYLTHPAVFEQGLDRESKALLRALG